MTLAPPPATLASASLPARVARVLEDLLRSVRDALDIPFDRALDELDQALVQLAGQARDADAQATHLEMRARLRRLRAQLFPAFMAHVEARLAALRGHHGHARPVHRQLALVDDQQLEEEAALRDIAQRQEARASLALHLLGQRFGVLARSAAFDAARLPLGPRALGESLRESSQGLALDAASRRLLFKAFDRAVMAEYEAMARRLDDALASAGVLPGLTHVPLRVRPAPPPPNVAAPAASPPTATPPVATTAAPAAGGSRPAGGHGAPGSGGATLDEGELFALVRRLLAASPGPSAHAPSTLAPAPPGRVAGGSGQGDVAAALALVDLLLHEVRRAMRADAPAHALLDRLREPLHRLTMHDRGLLTRPGHPARRVLNAVAESGAAWTADDDVDPQLVAGFAEVVEGLAAAPRPDAAAFEAAWRTVQALLDPLARRAEISERRLVEAARGKARLELAKRRAAAAVAERVGPRTLPAFVQALLDHAWADALTLTLLRHGDASDEWRQRLADTEALVELAATGRNGAACATLAGHVREALLQVGYHADDAQAIAMRLAAGIGDPADDPAARSALAARLQARARLGDAGASALPSDDTLDPPARDAFDRLLAFPAGTWFDADLPGGGYVRRRLSWHDAATGQALFVNLRGQRAEEPSLHDVARRLARGALRPVADGHSLVDRAWGDAIASMRAHLAGLEA